MTTQTASKNEAADQLYEYIETAEADNDAGRLLVRGALNKALATERRNVVERLWFLNPTQREVALRILDELEAQQ